VNELTQSDAFTRAVGLDIFEHRSESTHTLPYRFIMPGIAISGEPALDWDTKRKQWHLKQSFSDKDPARCWEAWGDSQEEAVLELIRMRLTA